MADHFVCYKHGVCISAVEGVTPGSVEEWLQSLRLSEYLDTFLSHNYNTMDRVRNIWELELNSVSESMEIHMQNLAFFLQHIKSLSLNNIHNCSLLRYVPVFEC